MEATRKRRILRQFVQTDALLGVEAVPVGDTPPALAPEDDAPPSPTVARPTITSPAPHASPSPASATASSAESLMSTQQATETSNPTPAPKSDRSRQAKAGLLTKLDKNEVQGCTKCGLCDSRTNTVFGEGDPNAQLMFIGEGPGQNEDEQGRPFVGRAGELLNNMIKAMGLEREQVFIANIVKCRPPNNRTPTPSEAETCFPHLRKQILIIEPQVIVTLGGPAAKQMLDTKKGITALRGIWHTYHGLEPDGPPIPIMPTFHPAYLLRAYTKENRQKVWSDLKAVMDLLGMNK